LESWDGRIQAAISKEIQRRILNLTRLITVPFILQTIYNIIIIIHRHANYFVKDDVLHRTLFKAYGIRFVVTVIGKVYNVTDY
jgi:hypothetical protein